MSKLWVLSGAEVCRILEKHGFVVVRQKGSHIIMQRKNRNKQYHCSRSQSQQNKSRNLAIH